MKGKYLVEVVGHDKTKVLWEVVGDNVVEEPSDHEDIGVRGFGFNISGEDEGGGCKGRVQWAVFKNVN